MHFEHIACPICGNYNAQFLSEKDGTWHCLCCDSVFLEKSAKKEYEKLESVIKSSLKDVKSAMDEALLKSKMETYYNLRKSLYKEISAEYIDDSNSIVTLCEKILEIAPDDFLAEFLLVMNSKSDAEIAKYIKNIKVEENAVYMESVLDFLIISLREKYKDATSVLLNKCEKIFTPETKQKYLAKFETEVKKLNDGTYNLDLERHVFLAYSSADMPVVVDLLEFIESKGLTCFASFRNLQRSRGAYSNYQCAIEKAINNCYIFLFISSQNSRTDGCGAYSEELVYIRGKEKNAYPEYIAYSNIPDEFKKLRIEYRIDGIKKSGENITVVEQEIKNFFGTLTCVENKEQLFERLVEYKAKIEDLKVEKNRTKITEGKGNSTDNLQLSDRQKLDFDEAVRRKVAEELKRIADEEAKQKAEEEVERKVKENNETAASTSQRAINKPVATHPYNGYGRANYPNGYYEGEWKDGTKTGKGTFVWNDGDRYEGEFAYDRLNGKGTFFYKDGNYCEGEFKDAVICGKGTFVYKNGNRYVGEFLDGKMHGKGLMFYKDGSYYKGNFAGDKFYGKGTYVTSQGVSYTGNWTDQKTAMNVTEKNAKKEKRHGNYVNGRFVPDPEELTVNRRKAIFYNVIGGSMLFVVLFFLLGCIFHLPQYAVGRWVLGIVGGIMISAILISLVVYWDKGKHMLFYKSGTLLLGICAINNLTLFLITNNNYNVIGGCFSVLQLIIGIVLLALTYYESGCDDETWSMVQIGELIFIALTFIIFAFDWLSLPWGTLQWVIGIGSGIVIACILTLIVLLLHKLEIANYYASGTILLVLLAILNTILILTLKDSYTVIGGSLSVIEIIMGMILYLKTHSDFVFELGWLLMIQAIALVAILAVALAFVFECTLVNTISFSFAGAMILFVLFITVD